MSCYFPSARIYLSFVLPISSTCDFRRQQRGRLILEPTNLLVYRDADYDVQFVLTDQISVIALQLLAQLPEPNGIAVVAVLTEQNPNLTAQTLTPHLSQALSHFAKIGAIVATR